jgi:hypothetical protein
MMVFLDDSTVYGNKKDSFKIWYRTFFENYNKCLFTCGKNGISLNPKKYYLNIYLRRLWNHVPCKDGLLVEPKKMEVIKRLFPPTIV